MLGFRQLLSQHKRKTMNNKFKGFPLLFLFPLQFWEHFFSLHIIPQPYCFYPRFVLTRYSKMTDTETTKDLERRVYPLQCPREVGLRLSVALSGEPAQVNPKAEGVTGKAWPWGSIVGRTEWGKFEQTGLYSLNRWGRLWATQAVLVV